MRQVLRFPVLLVLAGCPEPTPPTPFIAGPPVCDGLREAFFPVERTWTGDLETCLPGSTDTGWNQAAVGRINFARSLAGVPPIRLIADDAAQGCALLLARNAALSHDPPDTWACYDDDRAAAAARSLIISLDSLDPLDAVQALLVDPGNPGGLGHRRWVLSPWLQGTALGTAPGYACMDLDAPFVESTGWTAWPPPGDTPVSLLRLATYDTDVEGWMVMSDDLDLTGAGVVLTYDGVEHLLASEPLTIGLGSRHGIRFVPPTPVPVGVEWAVRVQGVGDPIVYTGRKVDCAETAP